MGWKWFSRGSARDEIAARLKEPKQEPELSVAPMDVADHVIIEPTLMPETASATIAEGNEHEKVAVVDASATSKLAFNSAPKISLRVQRAAATQPSSTSDQALPHARELQSAVQSAWTGPEQDAAAPSTLDEVSAGLDDSPQEAEAEPGPPAAPDYLAIGRTINTFGHALQIPADDARQADWAEQRVARGFDDTELWNLDDTIARFIRPRLKALRAKEVIPPTGMPKDQWLSLMDKMIVAFDLLLPEGGGTWSRANFTTRQRAQVQEGLDLFRQYFFQLCC